MTKYESRIGKIQSSAEKAYTFLSDFNNFKQFIPDEHVQDWQSDQDSCSFTVGGIGQVGLKIIEKEPPSLIKITGSGMASVEFYLWIQLKEMDPGDTRVKITMKADLPPMMQMMASKPLKSFLGILVDKMEEFDFESA